MIQLQLVGIKNKQYIQWKENLLRAIKKRAIAFKFEEINDVDQIIKLNLNSIPSLIINNQLELEQHNYIPDVREFNQHLEKHLSNKFNIENMIVPMDLSRASANAYNYAKGIANIANCKIKAINFFQPQLYPDTGSIQSLEERMDKRKSELRKFIHKLDAPSNNNIPLPLPVEEEVLPGFPAEKLVNLSKENNTDLIVMGTTGESGLLKKILGSVSSKVSQQAHCPVWLVPPNASFNGIKNILFASNYQSADHNTIQHVLDLSTFFNAQTHLVHINEFANKGYWKFEEFMLEELFNKVAPGYDFKINMIHKHNVWKGIFEVAQESNMDLIVLVTKHRNFIERLSHQSLTNKMIHAAKVPILVLHLGE